MSELHDRIESVADLFIAGALENGDRSNVETHAASCGSCAAVLKDAGAFAAWARGSIAADAPPADLEERIIARFRLAVPEKRQWIRNFVRSKSLKLAGWAAAVACMIPLGGSFSQEESVQQHLGGDDTAVFGSIAGLGEQARREVDKTVDLYRFRLSNQAANASTAMQEVQYARQEVEKLQKELHFFTKGLVDHAESADQEDMHAMKGDAKIMWNAEGKSSVRDELADKSPGRAAGGSAGYVADLEPQVATGAPARDPQAQEVRDTRKIIRNATVNVEVESWEKAQARINEIVAADKGMVASADTSRMANGKIQAQVTLRVPPEKFEAVLAKLRELGTVHHQSMGSQDVTKAYSDLDLRLGAKQTLLERLKKVLADGKGTIKEMMEVEVQMGTTIEQIEQIKGELKYYDNLIGMATITMTVSEKDLGLPFEYVQTMSSNIGLTVGEIDAVYAKAQKLILDAGGQVIDSKMMRQNDGSSAAQVQGRVDAEKFPGVREAVRALGHVDADTVNVQQTARGGSQEGSPKAGAPVRKEQALVAIRLATPRIHLTRQASVTIEAASVKGSFQKLLEGYRAAGAKVTSSNLSDGNEESSATINAQVDLEKFAAIFEDAKKEGSKIRSASVNENRPVAAADGTVPLVREQGSIALTIVSPPKFIAPESGLGRLFNDTFSGSINGVATSLKNLFIGVALAGPWIVLAGLAWIFGRRLLRKAKPTA